MSYMRSILSLLAVSFSLMVNAQYDFRTIPRQTDVETFYLGNRALSDGSFATVGIVEDNANGLSHLGLIKFNCLGEVEWAKALGGSILVNNIRGGIVEADNGDIVFAYSLAVSWTTSSMLVGRFTPDGDMVWMKRVGIAGEYARDIIATEDGGFVVAGSTSTYGEDRQRADIYLIKMDGNGEVLWTKTYGNLDAYDDAYGISNGSNGEILVTGRYIVGGTFYGFFLRADANGDPITFKGYGQPNHRTFAYDVVETPEGDYLISGYTSIAKVDWMSNGDAYLLKVDKAGELIWGRIYEPLEDDRNDFGFSIVLEDDGEYGIALETSSFSAIGGPQAPNKNVIYSVTDDGFIKYVQLFNPKGSQYTSMTKAPDGGYFLTGFSTYYFNNNTFEGFAFKTDENYNSGTSCEYYDRSDKVSTLTLPWDTPDLDFLSNDNTRSVDYAVQSDLEFDSLLVLCFRYPEISTLMEPVKGTYCRGQSIILGHVSQGDNLSHIWSMGNGDTLMGGNLTYAYDSVGTFQIILTTTDGCQSVYDTSVVEIEDGETFDVQRQLCPGDSLTFMDSVLKEAGVYRFVGSGTGPCDSIFVVTVTQLVRDTLDREVEICPGIDIELYGQIFNDVDTLQLKVPGQLCDTIVNLSLVLADDCPCLGRFPNAFTPNNDGMNDTYGMVPIKDGCSPIDLDNFEMTIFNRWGQQLFTTKDTEEKWDGRFNGEDCVAEVYLVTYTYDYEGSTISKTIDITLVR